MKTSIIWTAALLLAACGDVVDGGSGDQPTVSMVTPDHGPAIGGATVTLTGSRFQSDTPPIVVVGGRAATDVMVMSDSAIMFTAPDGEEGVTVDVTVSNGNGFATKVASYTFNPIPRVLSISPPFGKSVGGSVITITGRGFMSLEAGNAAVMLAGSMATNVMVVDDKTIKATNAGAVAGTAAFTPTDVVVTNANGASTLKGAFQVTTPGILAVERSGERRVFHVDGTTGAVSQFANAPRGLHGCTTNATDGKLYCVARPGGPQTNNSLVNWDPFTNVVTTIAELKDAGNVNRGLSSLVFVGNNLFGFCSSFGGGGTAGTNQLASVNITTGVVTFIGAAIAITGRDTGLAIRDGANLYFADRSDQSLDSVAIATGVVTPGPAMSGANNTSVRGLMTIGSTVFIADRGNPGGIFSVNTTTGVLTRFATLTVTPASIFPAPPSF